MMNQIHFILFKLCFNIASTFTSCKKKILLLIFLKCWCAVGQQWLCGDDVMIVLMMIMVIINVNGGDD